MDKLELFIKKYSDTLNFEQDAQLNLYWKKFIAPSCVNMVIVLGGMDAFYECYFCQKRLLYQSGIIRHYREQHAARLPKDIFGATDLFGCKVCDVKFKRDEHFNAHLATAAHLEHEDNAFQIQMNINLNKRGLQEEDEQLMAHKKIRIDEQHEWPIIPFGPSPISSERDTLTMQEALDFVNMDESSHVHNESIDDDTFQKYFLNEDLIIKNERARAANQLSNKLVKSISSDMIKKLNF